VVFEWYFLYWYIYASVISGDSGDSRIAVTEAAGLWGQLCSKNHKETRTDRRRCEGLIRLDPAVYRSSPLQVPNGNADVHEHNKGPI